MIHSTSLSHKIFASFSQIGLPHLVIIDQTPSLIINHNLTLSFD
jgi:hypothetical protein